MSSCLTPIEIRNPKFKKMPNEPMYVLVPCGKCIGCLKEVSDQWSTRCLLECDSWDSSYFVTLTYEDENLPSDGVQKRHIQLFHKRIRKAGFKFKYIIISEYGPNTHRPHYHGIYYGLPPYVFHEFWKYGFVMVKEVNENNIRYVCGYHILKNSFIPGFQVNNNFKLCSKGLGFDTFVNKELENAKNNDWRFIVLDGKFHSIPRYYRKKFGIVFDNDMSLDIDRKTFFSRKVNTENFKYRKFINKQI